MIRKRYFDYIEEKLHTLSRRIETRGKLNLLDMHVYSEDFYAQFFNLLYGYNLKNLNIIHSNVEAIDLIDDSNNIIIQVSATSTKQKIESSLTKATLKKYSEYSFKFISISKDASTLRNKEYKNPHNIKFYPENDIYDVASILNDIRATDIDNFKIVYEFIKKELGSDVDRVKLDSNLAAMINFLSKEDWDNNDNTISIDCFEIDKKITFNDLESKRDIIEEYFVYHTKVDRKYSEFDSMGANKSKSVLAAIHRLYLNCKYVADADTIFSLVIDGVKEKVLDSNNFEEIPIDELELCIDILVVDAFIRCKIFENPEGYCYATS